MLYHEGQLPAGDGKLQAVSLFASMSTGCPHCSVPKQMNIVMEVSYLRVPTH